MNDWPHAPVHRFGEGGVYFVTGGTFGNQHFFEAPRALDNLQQLLFEKAREHQVALQAWCLFSNHYHLVVTVDEGARIKCSARWFAENARPAFVATMDAIKIDRVSIYDDYGVRRPQPPLSLR
ncbi:MAG TPA: hypothetical protein VEK79_18760 [Thermoanaerobaculia bacterium]|nr:hypothetical protein [Thermoanaerobaculia bacterium]